MSEEPPIAPEPVVIPGQDSPGPLPGADVPNPPPPPEFGPDVPQIEIPDTNL